MFRAFFEMQIENNFRFIQALIEEFKKNRIFLIEILLDDGSIKKTSKYVQHLRAINRIKQKINKN